MRLLRYVGKSDLISSLQIAEVPNLSVPAAAGIGSPVILLPEGLKNQLSAEHLDQILLHEYAHLHRKDDWTNLMQCIAQCILVHHPVAHYLSD